MGPVAKVQIVNPCSAELKYILDARLLSEAGKAKTDKFLWFVPELRIIRDWIEGDGNVRSCRQERAVV